MELEEGNEKLVKGKLWEKEEEEGRGGGGSERERVNEVGGIKWKTMGKRSL